MKLPRIKRPHKRLSECFEDLFPMRNANLFAVCFLALAIAMLGTTQVFCQSIDFTREQRLTPVGEDCRHGTMIRVAAEIQGSREVFFVDSGATGHIVDRRLREYLSPPIGYVLAKTANGDIAVTIHVAPSIKIHSRTIDLDEVAMIDFSQLDCVFGHQVSGLLGAPMAIDHGLGFDREGDFFYSGRATARSFDSTFPLEITETNKLYTSDIRQGHDVLRCMIDTGMNTPLSIPPSYFDELKSRGLLRELHESRTQTGNGILVSRLGLLAALEVWGHRFEDVPVSESESTSIGLGLLERFSFFLNGPARLIEASKHKHTNDPFLYDRSGLEIESIDEKFTISYIRPNSPAEKAKLMTGTVIVAVNDKTVDPNWKELFRLRELFSTPGPVALKLQLESDSIRRDVVLEW